jgi:hypothetical protein
MLAQSLVRLPDENAAKGMAYVGHGDNIHALSRVILAGN